MSEVETQRLRFDLRYDGTGFHGWAKQRNLRTVQGELEAVLETVFQRPVDTVVAGRTDAGVHAASQVAHADVPLLPTRDLLDDVEGDQTAFRRRLNGLLAARYSRWLTPVIEGLSLPKSSRAKGESDLIIQRVVRVDPAFNARFSALQRRYAYRIVDNALAKNPVTRGDQWWAPDTALDLEAMKIAAAQLVGEHDFLSFCKPRDGATTVRQLKAIGLSRDPSGVLEVGIVGDAFCHNMVRAVVGALVEVGRGRQAAAWVGDLVAEPSRNHGVPVAPAKGLTLVGVDYPPPAEWEARSEQARAKRTLK